MAARRAFLGAGGYRQLLATRSQAKMEAGRWLLESSLVGPRMKPELSLPLSDAVFQDGP